MPYEKGTAVKVTALRGDEGKERAQHERASLAMALCGH